MQTPGNVSVVAWSPNRQLIATGYDYPYRLDLWEVQTGAVRGTLPNKFLGPGLELCFSPDGMRLAGSDQGSIIPCGTQELWRRSTPFRDTRKQGRKDLERLAAVDRALDRALRGPREQQFATDPGSINEWLLLGPAYAAPWSQRAEDQAPRFGRGTRPSCASRAGLLASCESLGAD